MANRDLSLALRLYADSARFVSGLVSGERGVRHFSQVAKREFDIVKGAASSIQGQLAALGLTTGAVAGMAISARMDKSLTQIGQTAGVSRAEVEKLRSELFRMGGETGQSVDDLQRGFSDLVAAGLSFKESSASINAINQAMSISTVTSSDLANALTVASAAFKFDLSAPGKAVELLDKMTVAGGLGSAELNKLPDIFARVGVNAASAGMGFEKTLAFIEVLSKIEKQPERLGTLADSTLRLFNNANYMKEAAKTTGVKFFEKDAQGRKQARDPIAVLRDIKKEYDKLADDKERFIFINKAFGKSDLDTIKGLKTLLGEGMLDFTEEFEASINKSSGEVARRMPEAISNMVDQTGRLKAKLREAADDFAKPINDALQQTIKWGLDKKEDGGLGLGGKEVIAGGAALALGTAVAARYGGMAVSGLAKRFGNTAAGVAEGKALQAAAGVTPVFVVNWPASMGGAGILADAAGAAAGGAGAAGTGAKIASRAKTLAALAGGLNLSAWGAMGARGIATAAGGVVGAGAGGYALGSYVINPLINAITSWAVGREETLAGVVYDFLHKESEPQKVEGEIRVKVDQEGRVTSVRASAGNRNVSMNVDAGLSMMGP